jgi:hypothetical protein
MGVPHEAAIRAGHLEWLRRVEHGNPSTNLLLASALALICRPAGAKKALDQYRAYFRG